MLVLVEAKTGVATLGVGSTDVFIFSNLVCLDYRTTEAGKHLLRNLL